MDEPESSAAVEALLLGRGTRQLPVVGVITRPGVGHDKLIRRELPLPRSNVGLTPLKARANSLKDCDDFEDSDCEEDWC